MVHSHRLSLLAALICCPPPPPSPPPRRALAPATEIRRLSRRSESALGSKASLCVAFDRPPVSLLHQTDARAQRPQAASGDRPTSIVAAPRHETEGARRARCPHSAPSEPTCQQQRGLQARRVVAAATQLSEEAAASINVKYRPGWHAHPVFPTSRSTETRSHDTVPGSTVSGEASHPPARLLDGPGAHPRAQLAANCVRASPIMVRWSPADESLAAASHPGSAEAVSLLATMHRRGLAECDRHEQESHQARESPTRHHSGQIDARLGTGTRRRPRAR
jgi:hypothetical protein